MILTVFGTVADPSAPDRWQSELLEFSWRQAAQPGGLVRLAAGRPGDPAPSHRFARVVKTLTWNPHPYADDRFSGYNLPASLLEWLFRQPVDATILLLDTDSAFRKPVCDEVKPGTAVGTPWPDLPRANDGPFGLGGQFAYLDRVCVDRSLKLPQVSLPVLIHSHDLLAMAARWLELTLIIRKECRGLHGGLRDAHRIAYTIAAAERRIHHESRRLGVETNGDAFEAPIHHYGVPVETPRGEILWDPMTYTPWERISPAAAKPGPGRDLLALLEEKIAMDETGGELAFLVPRRREGVREARLFDQMLLDIPGQEDSLTLNASAAAIWELCNDVRTLADIASELQRQFEVDARSLRLDVERTAESLREAGALNIVQVSR